LEDDSHVSELIRALPHGVVACKPYGNKVARAFPIKNEMWLQVAHMTMDSTEGVPFKDRWVKGAGFPRQ
jgi:hypothetical protein